MKHTTEQQKDIIKVLCEVKEHITMQSYKNNPGYKWINDKWSTHDILNAMEENGLDNKKETLEYLEDMAHLFGKDK